MEYPRKRRRISSPSYILHEEAHAENDIQDIHPEVRERIELRERFKSRLESIFEKYGRDFSGVGDEIDLVTGQVVVDNGHLLHMQDEDDVGDESSDLEVSLASDTDETGGSPSKAPNHRRRNYAHKSPTDDETLASLRTPVSSHIQLRYLTPMRSVLKSPAKDPLWHIPDIPEINFRNRSEERAGQVGSGRARTRMRLTTSENNEPRRRTAKSPGGSLWNYPEQRKRTRRPLSTTRLLPNATVSRNEDDEQFASGLCDGVCDHDSEDESVYSDGGSETVSQVVTLGHHVDDRSGQSRDGLHRANSTLRRDESRRTENSIHGTKVSSLVGVCRKHYVYQNPARNAGKLSESTKAQNYTSYQEQISLEDMRMTFPAIGIPQALKDRDSEAAIRTSDLTSSAMTDISKWLPEVQGLPSAAALVPYGPGQCSSAPDSDRKPANSLPARKMPVENENSGPEAVHTNTSSLLAGKRALVDIPAYDDSRSRATSVAMDLMALGSDILLLDADDTPLSMRTPSGLQRSSEVSAEEGQDGIQIGSERKAQEVADSTPPKHPQSSTHQKPLPHSVPGIFSIPNTTQESESQTLSNTSGVSMTQATNPICSTQIAQEMLDVQASTKSSRSSSPLLSSPLSSMSSLDSRMAKSLEMLEANHVSLRHDSPSATASSEIEVGERHRPESNFEIFESSNAPVRRLSKADDQQSSQNEDRQKAQQECLEQRDQQILPQDPQPVQPWMSTASIRSEQNSNHSDVESVASFGPQSNIDRSSAYARVLQATVQPRLSVASIDSSIRATNGVLESTCDALAIARSPVLLDAAVTSKLSTTSKASIGFKSLHGSLPINRPFIPVRPHRPPPAPSDGSCAARLGFSKLKAGKTAKKQVAYETSCPIYSTSSDISQSRILKKQNLLRRSIEERSQPISIQVPANAAMDVATSRTSDLKATAAQPENAMRQIQRETTPIDSYCYDLADPWPSEPLPTDRIPGLHVSVRKGGVKRQKETCGVSQSNPVDLKGGRDMDDDCRPSRVRGKDQQHDQGATFSSEMVQATNGVRKRHHLPHPELSTTSSDSLESFSDESADPLETSSEWSSSVSLASSKHLADVRSIKPPVPSGRLKISNQGKDVFSRRAKTRAVDPNAARSTPAGLTLLRAPDQNAFPKTPGMFSMDGSVPSPRKPSPIYKEVDLLNEFGRGRPLTRANLLSLEEIPSTSQDTIVSFLDSQATTHASYKVSVRQPSSLVQQSTLRRQSVTPSRICGADGISCGRRYCFNCTSRAATQDEIEF